MRHRHGFTLVEVLVALVILGIVTGAIYKLLHHTQRLSLAQAEQVSLQSNVRTGSLVVPNELRELNTFEGSADARRNDILDPKPDAIIYRAMRGLGFVCQAPSQTEIRLLDLTFSRLRLPSPGRDGLYIFVENDPDRSTDDEWLQLQTISTVSTDPNGCGAGVASVTITLPANMGFLPEIRTPVRVYEEMELKLYSADGKSWLGARSVNTGEAIQPVLGPLTDGNGFDLKYYNSAGGETADRSAIKTVQVTVRGLTENTVRAGGSGQFGNPEEALVTQVLLRNSFRP